ncbi:MAG: hypothetical protein IT466_10275 [Moraxellaceae bacterium]|nr:hypothetical protein [Moraxellaceae bacterium]
MIVIEQRFIGSSSLQSICALLAPNSQLTLMENVTGYLAKYGIVQAVKLQHIRPDGSSRFVLEVLEKNTSSQNWYVILTLDRDFTGDEALLAYQYYQSQIKGEGLH